MSVLEMHVVAYSFVWVLVGSAFQKEKPPAFFSCFEDRTLRSWFAKGFILYLSAVFFLHICTFRLVEHYCTL